MNEPEGRVPAHETPPAGGTIPRPADDQVVYRSDPDHEVVGASRRGLDLPATLGGALAALGTLLLLSSLAGAAGTVGYQQGLEDELSIGGLVAGVVILLLAGVVGGWVAGRMARRRGGLHGLLAALWLVVLAALLALLAVVAGSEADVRDQVGLPDWFSSDAASTAAIISGIVALAALLLGGWLGGRLGDRRSHSDDVALTETRRKVRSHRGGISAEETR